MVRFLHINKNSFNGSKRHVALTLWAGFSFFALALPAFAGITSAYLEGRVLHVKCSQCTQYVPVNFNGAVASVDSYAWKGDTVVFQSGSALYSVADLVNGQAVAVADKVTDFAVDDSTLSFNLFDPAQDPHNRWLFAAPFPSSNPRFLVGVTDNATNYKLGGAVLAFSKGSDLYVATSLQVPQQTQLISHTGGTDYRVTFGVVTFKETAGQFPGLYALNGVQPVRITDHADKYQVGQEGITPYIVYTNSGDLFVVPQIAFPQSIALTNDRQVSEFKVFNDKIVFLKRDQSLHLAKNYGMGASLPIGYAVAQFAVGPEAIGYRTSNGDFFVVPDPSYLSHSVGVAGNVTDIALGQDGLVAFLSNNTAYIVTDIHRGTYQAVIANVSDLEVKSGIVHFVNNGQSRPMDYFVCQNALLSNPIP